MESRSWCQRLPPPACPWTGSWGFTHTTTPAELAGVQSWLLLSLSSCLVSSHKSFWQATSTEGRNSSESWFAESSLAISVFPCNPSAHKKHRCLWQTWFQPFSLFWVWYCIFFPNMLSSFPSGGGESRSSQCHARVWAEAAQPGRDIPAHLSVLLPEVVSRAESCGQWVLEPSIEREKTVNYKDC